MISDDWEKRIKQTGLLELWGLGFIPISAAVYGYWLHYGFHWPWVQHADLCEFSILLFILCGYALAGVACAWLAPHRNSASSDYVSPRQRTMFAALHGCICTVAMILLLCVRP
jgi:hypothetical protein